MCVLDKSSADGVYDGGGNGYMMIAAYEVTAVAMTFSSHELLVVSSVVLCLVVSPSSPRPLLFSLRCIFGA